MRIKCLALALAAMLLLGGCSYADNRSWSELSDAEKETVRQEYREFRAEFKEEFSEHHDEDSYAGRLANGILDRVERALDR